MMKSIVIFYSEKESPYAEEKVFDGKSARELSENWVQQLGLKSYKISSLSLKELFKEMNQICQKERAGSVVFAYDDLPFLNLPLTKSLIESHFEYKSEYTYADGYPYGFSPEIINSGTIGILAGLAEETFIEEGKAPVSRSGIFDFIKKDINSFEVNSIIANNDWRLYRFAFDCGKKEDFLASKNLFENLKKTPAESADKISEIACSLPELLKTIPAFYEIQVTDKISPEPIYSPYSIFYKNKYGKNPEETESYMPLDKLFQLIEKIHAFSSEAVISLSAWGEAFLHPDIIKIVEKILSYPGLSVFIESDGLGLTDEICNSLKSLCDKAEKRKNQFSKIMIVLRMDAFTEDTYKVLHPNGGSLEEVQTAFTKLSALLPGDVYPQFIRMKENEDELEKFFRFWNDKNSPSGGKVIIQKYNNYAGLLADKKTADLSPVERNVCWHLRRDMTILLNGDVPLCRCFGFEALGNVFEQPLEEIWSKFNDELINQIENKYCEKCRKCDEYYTFNF
ncbi:MAG: spiro-SPASM protein [Treponema sp.]|nr:spiro-SPASM protein [Treponema sp.]